MRWSGPFWQDVQRWYVAACFPQRITLRFHWLVWQRCRFRFASVWWNQYQLSPPVGAIWRVVYHHQHIIVVSILKACKAWLKQNERIQCWISCQKWAVTHNLFCSGLSGNLFYTSNLHSAARPRVVCLEKRQQFMVDRPVQVIKTSRVLFQLLFLASWCPKLIKFEGSDVICNEYCHWLCVIWQQQIRGLSPVSKSWQQTQQLVNKEKSLHDRSSQLGCEKESWIKFKIRPVLSASYRIFNIANTIFHFLLFHLLFIGYFDGHWISGNTMFWPGYFYCYEWVIQSEYWL